MTPFALFFLVVATMAILTLPRKWAPVPLLAGACYMTLGQGTEAFGLNLHVLRLLLLAGVIRVFLRSERPAGGWVGLDNLLIAWGLWALTASAFRKDPGATFINHAGMFFNVGASYFLFRCFIQSREDASRLIKVMAFVLVPVALEMLSEQFTHRNLFSVFGGVPEEPAIRNGRLRSQGPFAHAILAGTVGAVCIPLMVVIFRERRWIAITGLAACIMMVLTSASSGPLMSVLMALLALLLWRWRHWTHQMRVATVVGYVLLELVMKAPAYYLIARIDLAGGSTGWHRAELIRQALNHLHEWWWAGTDYTRHWMPYGVSWSPDHSDITNHYLAQGVRGGLPLMGLFIALLWTGFRYVGRLVDGNEWRNPRDAFSWWCLGCSLFAHATTCVSVAYFDQSIVFLFLTLAVAATGIGALKEASVLKENLTLAPQTDFTPPADPLWAGSGPQHDLASLRVNGPGDHGPKH